MCTRADEELLLDLEYDLGFVSEGVERLAPLVEGCSLSLDGPRLLVGLVEDAAPVVLGFSESAGLERRLRRVVLLKGRAVVRVEGRLSCLTLVAPLLLELAVCSVLAVHAVMRGTKVAQKTLHEVRVEAWTDREELMTARFEVVLPGTSINPLCDR